MPPPEPPAATAAAEATCAALNAATPFIIAGPKILKETRRLVIPPVALASVSANLRASCSIDAIDSSLFCISASIDFIDSALAKAPFAFSSANAFDALFLASTSLFKASSSKATAPANC